MILFLKHNFVALNLLSVVSKVCPILITSAIVCSTYLFDWHIQPIAKIWLPIFRTAGNTHCF